MQPNLTAVRRRGQVFWCMGKVQAITVRVSSSSTTTIHRCSRTSMPKMSYQKVKPIMSVLMKKHRIRIKLRWKWWSMALKIKTFPAPIKLVIHQVKELFSLANHRANRQSLQGQESQRNNCWPTTLGCFKECSNQMESIQVRQSRQSSIRGMRRTIQMPTIAIRRAPEWSVLKSSQVKPIWLPRTSLNISRWDPIHMAYSREAKAHSCLILKVAQKSRCREVAVQM